MNKPLAPQDAVQPKRKADITMAEHRCPVQHNLKNQNRNGRRPKHHNQRQLEAHRQKDLDGMKPQTRGDIEFQVRMVHAV